MIRAAKAVDIPALLVLLHEAHADSKYALRAGIDDTLAKKFLFYLIQRNGANGENGTWCYVSEEKGLLTGFLFGVKDRVHHVGTALYASDIFFYTSQTAHPLAASRLLEGFVAWAKKDPRVIEITLSSHDTVGERAPARLYEAKGFKKIGELYDMQIEPRAQTDAA